MSLQALQRRVSLWIHRPFGRLAGLLLLVAMVSAGLPTGNVHAHAGGDHDHDHSAQLAEEGSSGHEDPAPSEPADMVLHAHDVCTSATALSVLPTLILSAVAPVAPSVRAPAPPPPSAARIPPHRPPIA